jgi:hypothetical protein
MMTIFAETWGEKHEMFGSSVFLIYYYELHQKLINTYETFSGKYFFILKKLGEVLPTIFLL